MIAALCHMIGDAEQDDARKRAMKPPIRAAADYGDSLLNTRNLFR